MVRGGEDCEGCEEGLSILFTIFTLHNLHISQVSYPVGMRARRRRTRLILNWALGICCVGLFVGIVFPVVAGDPRRPGPDCISNVKQLGFGVIMYGGDHDDRAPLRDSWMDGVRPFVRGGDTLICPLVEENESLEGYGYAFNSLLDAVDLAALVKPEDTPLIYDSINFARNASDPLLSLPMPGRHKGNNTIGYADGHANAVAFGAPQGRER